MSQPKLLTLSDVTATLANTAYQLTATVTPASSIAIQGKASNAGVVYIGDSNVAAGRGLEVQPGDILEIDGPLIRGVSEELYLSDLYISAPNAGDKVKVVYFGKR